MHKNLLILICLALFFNACTYHNKDENTLDAKINLLHNINPFSNDSLVNVVIEIPAGTSQKWELNKVSGKLEWERITSDSLRVIDYLPYPANYGFIPQTLVSANSGGDGDPADVFVLGAAVDRETITNVRIIGIINMIDDGESDAKLLGVNASETVFDVHTFEMLLKKYPGVLDIVKLWLLNYKGAGRVEITSVDDEKVALEYVKTVHQEYTKELADKSTPNYE
jgi:inorganic pyrophosphatase